MLQAATTLNLPGTAELPFRPLRSSWLAGVSYAPCAAADRQPGKVDGILVLRLKTGQQVLYGVPAWVPGLLIAAKSPGRVWHRIVKGRVSQKVEVVS